ncbi:GNAT family N-acetyltransferase [Bacillus sp. Xin]|uniref:GNAT family N-acetyltransferase n=1 Tax=unclassified Bacillus (in: firmicutes) TaxID=185979 RepID=UPI00157214A9|nr:MULTISPECIES: GNAT family N-acetyltransferase [unclassified Bacillus (in: firmicutes)]MBC6972990.1 GNAT family N-acetyltransferase [Bacillus sp. Xin]NSW37637.1 GNAT family N-acetyltransferase [Bacillus sp. Xin1]
MKIIEFNKQDAEEIINLFYETVHSVNAKDYSKIQLDVWAPKEEKCNKIEIWRESFIQNITYVAKINDTIVGFSDMTHKGYLDRLYVHKNYQGKGIALALINKIEAKARKLKLQEINTNASITAKPFFQRRGYSIVCVQDIERKGVTLMNYHMKKALD